jgi:hypothetical protein
VPTATLAPGSDPGTGAPPVPAAGAPTAVRTFLLRYVTTLLPLLTALFPLDLGWELLGGGSWPAAAAVVTGWTVAVAAWVRRCDWPAGVVLAAGAAPAAVLAPPAALGWLSPAGLVLWGPVSTVLAGAVAMARAGSPR